MQKVNQLAKTAITYLAKNKKRGCKITEILPNNKLSAGFLMKDGVLQKGIFHGNGNITRAFYNLDGSLKEINRDIKKGNLRILFSKNEKGNDIKKTIITSDEKRIITKEENLSNKTTSYYYQDKWAEENIGQKCTQDLEESKGETLFTTLKKYIFKGNYA